MENIDQMFYVRKCEYCRGKDGKEKDVYESFQAAFEAAKYIEKDRKIYLDVYRCPHGNGWHLTKNKMASEIIERKEMLFQNNDIPLRSSDGSWEYIKDMTRENETEKEKNNTMNIMKNKNTRKDVPIKKRECQSEGMTRELSGKIMEFIKNVNIERMFKINLQNVFCANMIKNILDGVVNQITIYAENNNQIESYTILIMDRLLQSNKIVKCKEIKLNITGKSINGINTWCCNKVITHITQDLGDQKF
jgi:hypothetical protein